MKKKSPRKIGRPSVYTPALCEKICGHLRKARTVAEACKAVGIADDTFYDWQARGDLGELPFSQFSEAVRKAKAERIAALEDSVVKAGRKDWRAHWNLLQAYDPKRFAPRVRVHVEQELSDVLHRLKSKLSAEFYEQVLVAIVEGDGREGAGDAPGGEGGPDDSAGGEAVQPAPAKP